MKKLILSIGILAALAVVACTEENTVKHVNYVNCQVCEIEYQEQFGDQSYEVCVDADGIAYINNGNTQMAVDRYFSLYCQNSYEGEVPETPGDGSTDPGEATDNCVTCAAYDLMGVPIPEQTVCEGTNGNAFVGGIDSGQSYNAFITGQELLTDCN